MIVLTGGAGFIGSCFLWKLNKEGINDIIVVDNLENPAKNKNLENKRYREYIHKYDFLDLVKKNKISKPEFIIHMGACSSTTLDDEDYFMKNNFEYSKTLAQWAFSLKAPFMYASSAATYGDGAFGYDDSDGNTLRLKPLNFYGYSKHLFDLWVLKGGFADKVTGIKFFNVFGPNEYHKAEMMSVICKKFNDVRDRGKIELFKSYHKDYKDGEQERDFIYIKDALEVMYYFFSNPDKTGIFNLGTGTARSWNDIAHAMFSSLGMKPNIEYIDMPEYIRPRYQYFTEAKMQKLRDAGCRHEFVPLEESIKDYIKYLSGHKYL